jgi:hypothetical protein
LAHNCRQPGQCLAKFDGEWLPDLRPVPAGARSSGNVGYWHKARLACLRNFFGVPDAPKVSGNEAQYKKIARHSAKMIGWEWLTDKQQAALKDEAERWQDREGDLTTQLR